jgi:hypothetical protein
MTAFLMTTSLGFTEGPIPIPRRRQVAQNLHRLLSIKAGMRVVTCESGLEADAVYAEEGNPDTTWLCEQPLRIERPIGKRPHYTLDLATRNRDGAVCYTEVKPTAQLVEASDGRPKPAHWDEIEAVCGDCGFGVGFITDEDLKAKKILIANWRMLLPFAVLAYRDPDNELAKHILKLTIGSGMSLRDLCLAEPERDNNTVIAHIAMLLHQGQLSGPLASERVVPSTKIKGVDRETP